MQETLLRGEIGALHFKGFLKLSLFTKLSLFLTVREVCNTDFIIGHQNNIFIKSDKVIIPHL